MRKLLRRLARFRAEIGGYFWLPCPLCGEFFGGQEWKDRGGTSSSLPTETPGLYVGICPACTKAGRGRARTFDR